MSPSAPDGAFQQATFVTSAARISQCPPDEGSEIAFAGRSNAGKSSALNAICGLRKLARTSNTPGRTQLLNFFGLGGTRRLVDLPGYGYARVSRTQRESWGRLVEDYVHNRRSLAGVVLLMDVRHPLKPQDRQLTDWLVALTVPVHVLLTKTDKLSRGQAASTLAAVRKELAGCAGVTVQLFSAQTGQGVEAARALLKGWLALDAPP